MLGILLLRGVCAFEFVQRFVSTLEALEALLVVFAKFRIPGGKKQKALATSTKALFSFLFLSFSFSFSF
jgi:hypothetical protein